jgi:cell division ATPase FtsA
MIIKIGKVEDVNAIMEIIKEAVIDMESQEIFQWDNIYQMKM